MGEYFNCAGKLGSVCMWKSPYLLDMERHFSLEAEFVIQIKMVAVGSVRQVFNNASA